jgi:valyl-tRNA synthetase
MKNFGSYNHKVIEKKIYNFWEKKELFKPIKNKKKTKYFSIVIPPPNVTGSLHMGHALNNTIQDLLIRYKRNQGYETLWQPGTDHAGIATQIVVEKQLAAKGLTKDILGRKKFINEIWKWKVKSGNQIISQLKKLGSSCDWSRERFTMDEGLSKSVIKVFVELYKKKLIYKDLKLVNWDPVLQTAVSDLEVIQKEVEGKLYFIRYEIKDLNKTLTIATTRPETLFGDTALAVNPKDKRFKDLVGKTAIIPVCNREIKIIEDEYADPTQGSGIVKITPAHDFNDFLVGERNKLSQINIFTKDAKLNHNTPDTYVGLDRFDARTKLVQELTKLGLIEKIETIKHAVPYGDRSNSIIEPYLTEQWFLDAKKLAKGAIQEVKSKKTSFFPENWTKTYFQWMNNIQPWCISRQLWWGHQIPAWYAPNGEVFVANDKKEAELLANKKFKKNIVLKQDEDVLDTWFSSSLWAFATLGWPKKTYELKRFYSTSVLVTGFDIIFFWVARMMMMSLHFMKKVPFSHVYVHALVRDEKGQKMSKSKGNVIDPLDLIQEYGADALRFTLIAMSSPGRDVKLAKERVNGYKNFVTKIWNIFNFSKFNNTLTTPKVNIKKLNNPINLWILSEFETCKLQTNECIESYRFDEAAKHVYQFTWNLFCDWYIEFSKPILYSDNSKNIDELKNTMTFLQSELLLLLHPFMPFVTEELWHLTKFDKFFKSPLISCASKNSLNLNKNQIKKAKDINYIINFVTEIRSLKVTLGISPASFCNLFLNESSKNFKNIIKNNLEIIKRLGRIKEIDFAKDINESVIKTVMVDENIRIQFDSDINLQDQKSIQIKKQQEILNKILISEKKLDNIGFVQNAPKNIVESEREMLSNYKNDLEKINNILKSFL